MTLSLFDLTYKKKWGEAFQQLPVEQQDVYFTPEYYSLYENLGDGKALCFVFEKDGNIALYPFLINSVNDLGYNLDKQYYDIQGAYGYNGVVSTTYEESFINAFYQSFDEYIAESAIVAEFTRFHPLIQNKTFSEKYLNVVFDRYTIYLNLNKPIDEIFNSFQRTTRKQIRRGTSVHQIQVRVEYSNFDNNKFYPIYKETMNRVNSTDYLYFNKLYFEELFRTIPTIIFSAFIGTEMIASIICITSKQFIHGHLGGAKTQFLNYSPYSLLYYEIIKEAKKNNFKKIHFGGGSSSLPDDSLFQFKTNFSNTTEEFFIGGKIHSPKIYNEVVKQWSAKSPEKVERYKNFLLKYRH